MVQAAGRYVLVDYLPEAGSAAIDAGNPTDAPATDILSKPRPVEIPGYPLVGVGTAFDIGAYEAQELPPPSVNKWVLY